MPISRSHPPSPATSRRSVAPAAPSRSVEPAAPERPGRRASALEAVRLRRVNRLLADGLREGLADLHLEFRSRTPGDISRCGGREQVREDFLCQLTARIRRPGFSLVVAEANGLVGCALGFPAPGDSFRRPDYGEQPPSGSPQLPAGPGSVFVVTTLLVRAQPQEKDVARRLVDRLLADHHASLGVTLVGHDDYATLAALRTWGWQDAGESWGPSRASLSRVLVLPRTQRATTGPA